MKKGSKGIVREFSEAFRERDKKKGIKPGRSFFQFGRKNSQKKKD